MASRVLGLNHFIESSLRGPERLAGGPMVWSTSASVWAEETKAASNWLHGRYTPRASISQKNRPNRAVSDRFASS